MKGLIYCESTIANNILNPPIIRHKYLTAYFTSGILREKEK